MSEHRTHHLHHGAGGAALMVHVIPNAETRIIRVDKDGLITIQVRHAEVSGKANDLLVNFLAAVLQVPASRVTIMAGERGDKKLVTVLGMEPAQAQERILKVVSF